MPNEWCVQFARTCGPDVDELANFKAIIVFSVSLMSDPFQRSCEKNKSLKGRPDKTTPIILRSISHHIELELALSNGNSTRLYSKCQCILSALHYLHNRTHLFGHFIEEHVVCDACAVVSLRKLLSMSFTLNKWRRIKEHRVLTNDHFPSHSFSSTFIYRLRSTYDLRSTSICSTFCV